MMNLDELSFIIYLLFFSHSLMFIYSSDDFDPLKLYLAGIPNGVESDDIKSVFPHGTNIVIPHSKKSKRIFG